MQLASYWPRSLDYLHPSGKSGFMLGDILGRKAGLTCTEVLPDRFLAPRPPVLASPLLLVIDSFGEVSPLTKGLGSAELGRPWVGTLMGATRGRADFGVFLADKVGVV